MHQLYWKMLVLIAFVVFSVSDAAHADIADSTDFTFKSLQPQNKHPRTGQLISTLLSRTHYKNRDIDDSLSSNLFDNYIEQLDHNRMYFLKSDIQKFEQFRYKLDDALKTGQLGFAFSVYNTFQERFKTRFDYIQGRLQKPFDFTLDEQFLVDRSQAAYPIHQTQADSIWNKYLKNAALKLKLAEKDEQGIKETLTKRYRNYARRVSQTSDEDVFQLFMNALAECFDPHTVYMSPKTSEDFSIRMSHSLEGIGAALRTEDEYTKVAEIIPGGPADKSDLLHANDRIIGVGQGTNGEIVDVIGWRIDDVVQLIRGPKSTKVQLKIIPAEDSINDPPKTITLVRDKVQLSDRAAKSDTLFLQNNDKNYTLGIINIPDFYFDYEAMRRGEENYSSTTNDVKRIIKEFKNLNVDGIIIDLRDNGGGFLSEAINLTGLFIDEGPVVQVRDTRGRVRTERDDDEGTLYDGPLAVIVNRISASASEIFAAAIQDYHRGIILGSQSFGKGTVQNIVKLKRYFPHTNKKHGQVKMTVAKFYRIDGGSTQHQGVIPDIEFPTRYDAMEIGESSYDQALLWDEIKPVSYQSYKLQIDETMPQLKQLHRARMANDQEYKLLMEEIEAIEQSHNRKYVSLNYEVRKNELDQKEKRKDRRREIRKEKQKLNGNEKDVDFMIEESANILSDYLLLTYTE
ncbi:MAG: tail-specific protease [Caldithrix sp.]|nr:tail-specific protease [Caldithrix sp.]